MPGSSKGHDDHVQIAALEGFGQTGGVVLLDQQRHRRRRRMDPRNQVRQEVGSDGVDHAQLEGAGQRIAAGSGEFLDLARFEQHLFGLGDNARADVGDFHVGCAALEEGHRQLVLKLLDGDGKRRLADVATFGGMPEVALTGQRNKVAKIGKRHREHPQER